MTYHVLKPIQTAQHGRLAKGAIVDLPESVAALYLPHGAIERYETKVIRENPMPAAGIEQPSSASPAAQASPQTTSRASEPGEKPKRKRKRDE